MAPNAPGGLRASYRLPLKEMYGVDGSGSRSALSWQEEAEMTSNTTIEVVG